MNQAVLLANLGNLGLVLCAAIDTCAVTAYALLYRGDRHGRWWATAFGRHLMAFMAAFAIVLDQSVIYLLTGPGLIITGHLPLPRPDWFAWERVISFDLLLPAVLGWRLAIILRPPES